MRGGRESRTSQLFDMTDINELPTTPGGIRQMADVDMTVPFSSFRPQDAACGRLLAKSYPAPAHSTARLACGSSRPMNYPGIPSDGCVRLTLCFAGPAGRCERAAPVLTAAGWRASSATTPIPRGPSPVPADRHRARFITARLRGIISPYSANRTVLNRTGVPLMVGHEVVFPARAGMNRTEQEFPTKAPGQVFPARAGMNRPRAPSSIRQRMFDQRGETLPDRRQAAAEPQRRRRHRSSLDETEPPRTNRY